ncbi:hypothetical protein ACWZHB_09815 [Nocardia sp. FBN12]|uniref:hypothetical protein n=1 Tax=Nocardia sp. FBN12 TaxID=3419766 RepID=UPI003D04B914
MATQLTLHAGTAVLVSHDRIFLDRVVTVIIDVADGGLTRFGGGYTGFLTEKAAARIRWEQAYTQWRGEIGRLEEFATSTAQQVAPGRAMTDNNKMAYDRNAGRVQSSVASRVRTTAERLRRLRADQPPRAHSGRRGGTGAARVSRCGGRGVTRLGVAPSFPWSTEGN